MCSSSRSRTAVWAVWLCWLCLLHQHALLVSAAPPPYQPRLWNLSCNFTVSGIPAAAFFNRSMDAEDAQFPVSPGYRMTVPDKDKPSLSPVQLSCFGPGQRPNQTLIAAGIKMPCGYSVKADGRVDYWEESVCDLAIRSNCYCYSLNVQFNRGYCVPGYASTRSTDVDFDGTGQEACTDAARKVQLDGGKPLNRTQVYAFGPEQPEVGHVIALVVDPSNDFHFMRRDEGGTWSQKRGDTFVTNTYPNGSVVTDVEDPAILGSYSVFCGYFHVDPDTHANTDSTWTYSSVPKRLEQAQRMGYTVASTPLPQPSTGWMRLNYPYLLFGLDAAVFESGQRRLPWMATPPTTEAGSRGSSSEAGAKTGGGSGSSGLKPHWVSHVQRKATVQERERAVRTQYRAIVARSAGLKA